MALVKKMEQDKEKMSEMYRVGENANQLRHLIENIVGTLHAAEEWLIRRCGLS